MLVAALAAGCPSQNTQPASARRTTDAGTGSTRQQASTTGDAGRDPCQGLTPEQRALVVARVGETSLTLCDFARQISSQNQYLRARFQSPEQRRVLLRSWVDSELLAAEARARGLDRDPSVRNAMTSQLAHQLEAQLRSAVEPPIVTDAEIEAYFNEHQAEYGTPEQVRASHIVLTSREAAERVLADARAHSGDDAYWRSLANRESQDGATRESGGDLGYFAQEGSNTVPPEVARAAFGLRAPGDVAPQVVESAHGGPSRARGFHVVRFVARREALRRTLDEVRRAIRVRLWRERFDAAQERAMRETVERLRREHPVTVDEAALAQVRVNVPPGTPTPPGAAAGARGTDGGARGTDGGARGDASPR